MRRLGVVLVLMGACCLFAAAGWSDTGDACRVGVQLHLRPPGPTGESHLRHVRAFVERGMCDYALLVEDHLTDDELDEVVRYLAGHGVPFLVQENVEAFKEGFSGKETALRYDAEDYARIRQIAEELFLGVHCGELDSSGLKPEEYLPSDVLNNPTRRQVKEAFVGHVRERVQRFHDAFATPFAHSSAVLWHSLFAEAGVDVLCSEIGENIPNAGMMIASNRGAARAYGRPWMIDHSTWWAPRGHAGEQVSPREGHTPWCLFTSLLGATMGGADFVQLEVDWAAYDEDYRLRPWGRAMKTLADVAQLIGPRGNTVTRFAVLMGHESGWPGVGWRVGDVRGAGLFDGIRHEFMQTRDADLSLKILDVFYPGFERCGWDPEYPGFLAESPLGTLDFVPDNLPAEKYRRYAVLVALGYHRMTESLGVALCQYVEAGGVLVCGDTLFLDERECFTGNGLAEPLAGCTVRAAEEDLLRLHQPQGRLDAIDGYAAPATRIEWQDHWLHPVDLTTGRAVAWLDDTPYLIENRIGSGRVFFVTALNLVGSSAQRRGQEPFLYANILCHFLHTLEAHLGDGITFSPWNGLEHIFNERPNGTGQLLVMNHGDSPYRRDALLRNPFGFTAGSVAAQGTWEAWHSGQTIDLTEDGNTLAWSFHVPPKSFVLFEFR